MIPVGSLEGVTEFLHCWTSRCMRHMEEMPMAQSAAPVAHEAVPVPCECGHTNLEGADRQFLELIFSVSSDLNTLKVSNKCNLEVLGKKYVLLTSKL